MVAMLAGGSLYATWWARRNVRAIETQAPVDVSDLAEGYRLAWGLTVGPLLKAPLTGRECVWWKATIWESVREPESSGGHRYVWREATDEQSDRPILFGDGKTVAAVWPGEATMVSSAWSDWRGQDLPPEDRSPKLHVGGVPGQGFLHDVQGTLGPRFRYVEQIIPVDAPFFVLGDVSQTDLDLYAPDDIEEHGPTDADDEDRDRAQGEGWRPQPSTLGVLPTPDSVVAEDMSRTTWSIAAARKKPFLLSIDHPKAVSAEQELGAKGGLIMGALSAALAAVLLWLRFGSQ
ncbi:hypothetical protein [Alsobacter sp. R-9]